MTDEQIKKYTEVKERLRRIGKENPADAILYLAMKAEAYRSKIKALEGRLDKLHVINKLHEADNADLQKQLEQKVEEVYPEFMRDYKCMCEELDSIYDELEELTKERDELQKRLLREETKKGDVHPRLTPEKPIEEADDFGDRSLCCPHCLGPVTNYWVPGTKPKHCQFCGQALDWGEGAKG